MPIPTPPPDASGGYMLFEFTDGTRSHKHKVHVAPFSTSTGLYTSPGGSETSPTDTAGAYLDHVKNMYNSNWSLIEQELWQRTGTPSIFTIMGFTLASGRTGAGTPQPNQDDYAPRQITAITATAVPNEKLKLIYLSVDQLGLGATPVVTSGPATGGTAFDALAAYLISTNCMIRAHNGQKPVGATRYVRCLNHRLRRKYGDT